MLLSMTPSANAAAAKWIGEEIKAGGGFSQFLNLQNRQPHGITKSGEVVRAGKAAWRFEVRAGDCYEEDCEIFRERAEFSARPRQKIGRQVWYAFSIYLSPDFVPQPEGIYTFGQVRPVGGPEGFDIGMGQMSSPGLLYMDYEDGAYVLKVIGIEGTPERFRQVEKIYELKSITEMKGRWTDVVLMLDTKSEDLGLLAYIDGKEAVRYERKLIQFPAKELYFKFGIYRHFSIRNGKAAVGTFPTDVVYFDEVRVGKNREAVDPSVNPSLKPVN